MFSGAAVSGGHVAGDLLGALGSGAHCSLCGLDCTDHCGHFKCGACRCPGMDEMQPGHSSSDVCGTCSCCGDAHEKLCR
jgi:hypothetical protein